jgi:hypothetical protein
LPLVQHPRHHRGTHAAKAAKSDVHARPPLRRIGLKAITPTVKTSGIKRRDMEI